MEPYLRHCLDSLIIDKGMDELEVFVINDGSKDRSSKIAREYQDKYPNTFYVIDKVNGNYGSCINRGLKEARAIGGGALEAAERFEKIKGHYAVGILAAGKGTRFSGERGESKLHAKIDQKPMYMHMMDKMQAFSSVELFIVTGDEKIIEEAEKRGIFVVRNKEPEKGIAHSVVLGLKAVSHSFKSGTDRKSGAPDGILFSVCDQPKLKISTIQRILNDAALHKKNVICAGYRGQKGNPVLWPAHCFAELLELTGDEGGRQMLTKYEEKVRIIETKSKQNKARQTK